MLFNRLLLNRFMVVNLHPKGNVFTIYKEYKDQDGLCIQVVGLWPLIIKGKVHHPVR